MTKRDQLGRAFVKSLYDVVRFDVSDWGVSDRIKLKVFLGL